MLRLLRAPRLRGRLLFLVLGAFIAAALVAMLATIFVREPPLADHPVIAAGHHLQPVRFSDLPGWDSDAPAEALAALRRSCAVITPARRNDPFAGMCRRLADLPENTSDAQARAFFEEGFRPHRVVLSDAEGLLTAYYEPVIPGSRERSRRFSVPLLGLPPDYVTITEENRPSGFSTELSTARRTRDGLEAWPVRAEIEDGALDGIAEPLVWVENDVEAFFVHIQGSTRIELEEGGSMRVGFAGRNGHPYTSVGRVMMERGIRPEGGYSMDGMRAFFHAEPELGRSLMQENNSFIFFREIEGLGEELGPIGAQGIPLTTRRSLAVDPDFHRFGTPIFIDALLPTGANHAREPFQRLMIAQDTGAAIKGPARGDLFWGTGPQAGSVAGGIKAPGTFYLLLPRS